MEAGRAPLETEPAPRVVPWNLFGMAVMEFSTDQETGADTLTGIRVSSVAGVDIVAGSGYHGGLGHLDRVLNQLIVDTRLPAALEQFRTGAPVTFGPMSVSRMGVAWNHGTHWAGWRDMRWIEVQPSRISVALQGQRAAQRIALSDIPDSRMAMLLVQDLAGQLGVPQKGDPVQLPPALPEKA